jgi:hypothetical protein
MPNISPIADEHLYAYCEFLHQNLDQTRTAEHWMRGFKTRWHLDKPNNGFMLRNAGGQIVGGIGALYSTQLIRGKLEPFCNIASWCVLDAYRSSSMRLALALTSQKGYHFTNMTPNAMVEASLQSLKFQPMASERAVLFNMPWPAGSAEIVTKPKQLLSCLEQDIARIYRDHSEFPWLHHLAVGQPGAYCYVIFKLKTLREMPLAEILYLSEPKLFLKHYRALGNYFLLKRGWPLARVESRFLPRKPWPSKTIRGYRSKEFRSDFLNSEDISNLYSDLLCFDL